MREEGQASEVPLRGPSRAALKSLQHCELRRSPRIPASAAGGLLYGSLNGRSKSLNRPPTPVPLAILESPMRAARLASPLLLPLALLAACSSYQPFDSVGYLRSQYAERVGRERAAGIAVPFEIDAPVRAAVDKTFRPALDESRRIDQVL